MNKFFSIPIFLILNVFCNSANASKFDFIQDVLVEACGPKMKKAVIKTKLESRLWGGNENNVLIQGLVRVSLQGLRSRTWIHLKRNLSH